MKKQKPYWEMNTAELAAATKQFDDPSHHPRTLKMTPAERSQLRRFRRWQRKNVQRSRLTLMLHPKLVEQTDTYAAEHGLTLSDVVTDALRKLIQRKSA